MVVGFNHNIKHGGRIYHVQTEDSGRDNPHVITHLFVGGNIVASKKTSYADIVGADNLSEVVRELMEEQHKEMLRNLINGVYDGVESTPPRAAPAARTPEARSPAASPRPPPIPAARPPAPEVAAARQASPPPMRDDGETLFGEDLISEKSLDEVILSYLAEDLGERKP